MMADVTKNIWYDFFNFLVNLAMCGRMLIVSHYRIQYNCYIFIQNGYQKRKRKKRCNDVNLMYNNDQRLAPFTLVNLPYIIKNQQSVITGTNLYRNTNMS